MDDNPRAIGVKTVHKDNDKNPENHKPFIGSMMWWQNKWRFASNILNNRRHGAILFISCLNVSRLFNIRCSLSLYEEKKNHFQRKWTLHHCKFKLYLDLKATLLLKQIFAESRFMKNWVVFMWLMLLFIISVQGSFCNCNAVSSNWISLRRRSNGCNMSVCSRRARLPNVDIRDDVCDSWIWNCVQN